VRVRELAECVVFVLEERGGSLELAVCCETRCREPLQCDGMLAQVVSELEHDAHPAATEL